MNVKTRLGPWAQWTVDWKAGPETGLRPHYPLFSEDQLCPTAQKVSRAIRPVWCKLLGAIALVLGVYSVSFAAGYQVLSDTSFPIDRPLALVHGLKATRDGGYLILGQAGGNELRLIKTYPSGEKDWERIVPGRRGSEQYPLFALEEDAGGYWVVGMAKELEFMPEAEAETAFRTKKPYEIKTISFIAKFNAAGEMESRVPLGQRENFQGSRFVCGVRTTDGIVLIGTKYVFYDKQPPHGGRRVVVHPWVVKLDAKGTLLWETLIADDGEGVFSGTTYVVNAKSCGGPYFDKGGAITFGLTLAWYPTYYNAHGVRIVTDSGTEDKAKSTYLVMALDINGKEIGRRRLDSEVRAGLLRSGSEFVVVSNPVPVDQGRIRRTLLKQDLSVVRIEETKLKDNTFLLEGSAIDKSGNLQLAGFSVGPRSGRGRAAVSYLTAEGKLVNVRTLDLGLPNWDIRAYSGGVREAETAIVLQSDATVRLLRLKYLD